MTGFDMSDLMPPPDAKDAFERAHVEGLQSLYVTTIWGPCLATIQEDRDANGFVDCDFGRCCLLLLHYCFFVCTVYTYDIMEHV